MKDKLDIALEQALGRPSPMDMEQFADHVMGHLRRQLRKEEQFADLRNPLYWGVSVIKIARSVFGRYSTSLKYAAGLSVVILVIFLTRILIPNSVHKGLQTGEEFSTIKNETLSCYILNKHINTEETKPCNILPFQIKTN